MLRKDVKQFEWGGSLLKVLIGMLLVGLLAACTPTSESQSQMPTPEPDVVEPAVDEESEPTAEVEEVETAVPQPDITGIRWVLLHTVVGGDAVVPAPDWTDVYFKIEEGGIIGNSGCNQFNGAVMIEGATISFGPLASTRMACGEDTMGLETAVLASLQTSTSFFVQDKKLTFKNSDGLPIIVFTAAEEKTLYVGSEQVDCVGVVPQQCLLVKENVEDEYTYFYDSIRFFEWEAGSEYELRVAVTEIAEPGADGSSLSYTLIEVVNKTLVATGTTGAEGLFDTVWQWVRFDSPSEDHSFEVTSPENYTLQFMADGSYQIQNDCNVGNGRYTATDTSVTLEPALTTLAFCGEASLDMQFSRDLQAVGTYILSDGTLFLNLKYDSGNIVMEPIS